MIVKAQSHPALSHFVTKAMRFYIDCDDLTVGDVLKFSLHCYASQNNKQYFLDSDDNEGLCYQVNCTPKLNPWAAKAAQELKNYAPIVKYNCMHNSKDSESKAAKSLSEDSLQPWNTFLLINFSYYQLCIFVKHFNTKFSWWYFFWWGRGSSY